MSHTIYIMGPYTAPTTEGKEANTRRAMEIGVHLIRLGWMPFVPHLTHYLDMHAKKVGLDLPNEFWYRYDFQWMPLCGAGFFIAPSPGADKERAILEALHCPIYFDLREVPDVRA
jgi:hypothetical protein